MHKIKQFADDCTCFLKDIPSIYTLIETISGFSLCSGLKLNADKSVILFLGPWKNKNIDNLNMVVEQSNINVLGVQVGRDHEARQQSNFIDKLAKIKNQFHMFISRDVSICGRILITKTFGISKLIYSLSTQKISQNLINTFQAEFDRYIWGYKPAKVKHKALICNIAEGGLRALDIESYAKALRLTWINRIITGKGWNGVINSYLEPMGGLLFLLRCNYDTSKLPYIPTFYREILDYIKNILCEYVGDAMIWNNQNVLVNGKSIFIKEWYEKGVIFFNDLCNCYGKWLSYENFCQKYNIKIHFLGYYSILNAVKSAVKYTGIDLTVKREYNFSSTIVSVLSGRKLNLTKAKSKDYYNEFVELISEPPKSVNFWRINHDIDEDTYFNSLILTKRSTREPKLIAQQFKIVHNILNCNSNLFKWKISITDVCQFCDSKAIDTTLHALYECPSTKKVLKDTFRLIDENKTFTPEKIEFVFGVEDTALNLIFILIKRAIIQCRTHTKICYPQSILKTILHRIIIDHDTLNKIQFQSKWHNYDFLVKKAIELRK